LKVIIDFIKDSSVYTAFFVFYSISTTKVLQVLENSSEALLELYLNSDCLQGVLSNDSLLIVSTPFNCEQKREAAKKLIYTVSKARNGGHSQAVIINNCRSEGYYHLFL
jgi:hypothetical protein